MPTKCKFQCTHKTENDKDKSFSLRLEAVTSGSVENDNFFKWTPAGTLLLNTINAEAAGQFEVGKEYYLDISPAV